MRYITSTHYNRPECTNRMIERLYKCKGIENYTVLFFIEPGCNEVADIIDNCALNKVVVKNKSILGLWTNKRQAVSAGFEKGDFIIHLEDDILLGSDALLYFEWADRTFYEDKNIFNVTAFNKIPLDLYNQYNTIEYMPSKVGTRHWYNSSAWATWKDRFENLMKIGWSGEDQDLKRKMHEAQNMHEVYPWLSRCQNIGHVNGKSSLASDIIMASKNSGENPYALAGISKTSNENRIQFSHRESYIEAIKKKLLGELEGDQKEILKEQLRKAEAGPLENQLIVTEDNQEIVKLDNRTVKSRNLAEYKERYFLDCWSGDFILNGAFEIKNAE